MVDLTEISPFFSLGLIFVVGLGLGASTTFDDFRHSFSKPKAVGIGFLSQYLFMPIAAYVLALIFRLDTAVAVGAVLVGCSPGGATSNLFTYWSSGDVALSITMSFLSTVAAFAFMPFWIYVLVTHALGSTARVAWTNIIVALVLILLPTVLGLMIRRWNTRFKIGGKFLWKWIELFATVFGILFMAASVVVGLMAYGNMFAIMPIGAWITSAIMQPLGCCFGYFTSKLLGMSPKDQRTISLETGLQSFVLTVAVIQISFTDEEVLKYALMFPVGYGFLYLFWSPVIVVFFRYYLAPRDPAEDRLDDKIASIKEPDEDGKDEVEITTDQLDENNSSGRDEESGEQNA